MYVNPFERMRKKREEEEKEKLYADKLRERYLELGAQIGIIKPSETPPTYIKTYIDPHEDLKYKSFNEENNFFELEDQQSNYSQNNQKINNTLTVNNNLTIFENDWIEQFNSSILDNQVFGYLTEEDEFNKFKQQLYSTSINKLIELDIGEITKYSSSLLFMLKQIINKLPTIINIEDKRALWERTSIFLSSTDLVNIEDPETLNLVNNLNIQNPISLFIEEFASLFDSYSIYDPIIFTLENTSRVDIQDLIEVMNFINQVLIDIPIFKFILNITNQEQQLFLENQGIDIVQEWIIKKQQQKTLINQNDNYSNNNNYDLEQIKPINEFKQNYQQAGSSKNYHIDVGYYLKKQEREEYEKQHLTEKSKNKEPITFHEYFLEPEEESKLPNLDKIDEILDGNESYDNQYVNIQRNLQRQNTKVGKSSNMISVPGGWDKLKK